MANKFKERFTNSHKAVKHTEEWFKSLGCKNISIPRSRLAPSRSEWKDYTDNGDIYIGKTRFEVKGLVADKYWFTTVYEYPYDNWIICAKHSYDRATPKPYAYLVWNNRLTHVGIIKTNTYKEWRILALKDPNYPTFQDFYVIDKTMVDVEYFEI